MKAKFPFSKFVDAGLLASVCIATLISLGQRYEQFFSSLVGLPWALFKPKLDGLVMVGWETLMFIDFRISNILAVSLMALLVTTFLSPKRFKTQLRFSQSTIKISSIVFLVIFIIVLFTPLKAHNRALHAATCLINSKADNCTFPQYEIHDTSNGTSNTYTGKIINKTELFLAIIECREAESLIKIVKMEDFISATLSKKSTTGKKCEIELYKHSVWPSINES